MAPFSSKQLSDLEHKAIDLVALIRGEFIVSTTNPRGLAAGLVYYAGIIEGVPLTQKMVAERSGLTEVTVRSYFAKLKDVLKI